MTALRDGARRSAPAVPEAVVERTPSPSGPNPLASPIDLSSPNKSVSEIRRDSYLLELAGTIKTYDPITR
eukprot:3339244-Rhodomonas_salina.1